MVEGQTPTLGWAACWRSSILASRPALFPHLAETSLLLSQDLRNSGYALPTPYADLACRHDALTLRSKQLNRNALTVGRRASGKEYSIAGSNEKRPLLEPGSEPFLACSRHGSTTTLILFSFPFSLALRRAVFCVCVGDSKHTRVGARIRTANQHFDVGSALPAAKVRLDQHQP